MRKLLSYLSMALVALTMSFAFTACGPEPDPDPNGGNGGGGTTPTDPEKVLTPVEMYKFKDGSTGSWVFMGLLSSPGVTVNEAGEPSGTGYVLCFEIATDKDQFPVGTFQLNEDGMNWVPGNAAPLYTYQDGTPGGAMVYVCEDSKVFLSGCLEGNIVCSGTADKGKMVFNYETIPLNETETFALTGYVAEGNLNFVAPPQKSAIRKLLKK